MSDVLPRWPVLLLTAVIALALVQLGDRCYPFTPFPMYAGFEGEADVLYVTDENDRPLPMATLFKNGSAQQKKRLKDILREQTGKDSYEFADATPQQLQRAAEKFLDDLYKNLKPKLAPELKAQRLRAWLKTLRMDGSTFHESDKVIGEKVIAAAP